MNPYTAPETDLESPDAVRIALRGSKLLRVYHRLILISILCIVVSAVVSFLPIPWPSEWQQLRDHHNFGSLFGSADFLIWLVFVLTALVARLGMLFLERWARSLLVIQLLVGGLLSLIQGMAVTLPVEALFGFISLLADGAILTLAYTQPLASAFKNTEV